MDKINTILNAIGLDAEEVQFVGKLFLALCSFTAAILLVDYLVTVWSTIVAASIQIWELVLEPVFGLFSLGFLYLVQGVALTVYYGLSILVTSKALLREWPGVIGWTIACMFLGFIIYHRVWTFNWVAIFQAFRKGAVHFCFKVWCNVYFTGRSVFTPEEMKAGRSDDGEGKGTGDASKASKSIKRFGIVEPAAQPTKSVVNAPSKKGKSMGKNAGKKIKNKH